MSTSIRQLLAESLLPADLALDLEPVVAGIEAFLPARPPAPSPALAALMANPPRPGYNGPRRRLVALASAAVVSSIGLTGAAAAANALPEPVQRLVATFTENVLPFVDIPQPDEGESGGGDQQPVVIPVTPKTPSGLAGSPTASDSTSPSLRPSRSPSASATPSPTGTASGEPSPSGESSPTGSPAPAEPPKAPPADPTTSSPSPTPTDQPSGTATTDAPRVGPDVTDGASPTPDGSATPQAAAGGSDSAGPAQGGSAG